MLYRKLKPKTETDEKSSKAEKEDAERTRDTVQSILNNVTNPKFKKYLSGRFSPRMAQIQSFNMDEKKNYTSAKAEYKELINPANPMSISAEINKYNALVSGASNAVTRALNQYGNSNDKDELKKTVTNYLNDSRWMPSDVPAELLKCVSGTASAYFTRAFGENETLNFSYSFSSGVAVFNMINKTNDKSEVINDPEVMLA